MAISTAMLRFFSSGGELHALHSTFVAVGLMTAASAFIFMLLKAEDGAHLFGKDTDTTASSRPEGKE